MRGPWSYRSEVRGSVLALLLVAALTAAMMVLSVFVVPTNRSIVFLIPVIAAATLWGTLPAVVSAVAGVVGAGFLLFPRVFTTEVVIARSVSLGLLIVVAIVTGRLASASKAQAELARKRENEVRDLYAFSRRLAVAHDAKDIYAAIQEHLSTLIQRKVVLFESVPEDAADNEVGADRGVPERVYAEVARQAKGQADTEGGVALESGDGNIWLVRPLSPGTPDFGVIAIDLGLGSEGGVEDLRRRIDGLLADAAATLVRLDVARVINDVRMRSETEVLREALIGSVSHELRTPLASILGSATILCNATALSRDERVGALAEVIRDEAERLNSDIQNLLEATRISSQAIKPRLQWLEPADLVNSALERRRRRLAGHVLTTEVSSDLPLLYVDPVLIEQALVQIIDNAAKYSPVGTTIGVKAGRDPEGIVVSVADQGVGFTNEEQEHLGERFFRGPRHLATVPGSGLGLWIANAFVTASGGTLEATSAGAGRGSTVSIRLPVVREALLQLEGAADE